MENIIFNDNDHSEKLESEILLNSIEKYKKMLCFGCILYSIMIFTFFLIDNFSHMKFSAIEFLNLLLKIIVINSFLIILIIFRCFINKKKLLIKNFKKIFAIFIWISTSAVSILFLENAFLKEPRTKIHSNFKLFYSSIIFFQVYNTLSHFMEKNQKIIHFLIIFIIFIFRFDDFKVNKIENIIYLSLWLIGNIFFISYSITIKNSYLGLTIKYFKEINNEKSWKLILNNLPTGVCFINENFEIIYSNNFLKILFNFDENTEISFDNLENKLKFVKIEGIENKNNKLKYLLGLIKIKQNLNQINQNLHFFNLKSENNFIEDFNVEVKIISDVNFQNVKIYLLIFNDSSQRH